MAVWRVLVFLFFLLYSQNLFSQTVLIGKDASELHQLTRALNNFSSFGLQGFKRRSDLEEWRYDNQSKFPNKVIEHSSVLERKGIIFWWKLKSEASPFGEFEIHFEHAKREDVEEFLREIEKIKPDPKMIIGETFADFQARKKTFLDQIKAQVLSKLPSVPKVIVPAEFNNNKPYRDVGTWKKIRSFGVKCREGLGAIWHWVLHPGN